MAFSSNLIDIIKNKFPKLFVTEIIDNRREFLPEAETGFIEYKRTLTDCSRERAIKYASQMHWRITENIRNQYAIYFIGVDDDGSIVGLSESDILTCIEKIVEISQSINASIVKIQIIHINSKLVLSIGVKIKKMRANFLVDFP